LRFTNRLNSKSDKNEITFPKLESWNPVSQVATIVAEVNKRRVLCRISFDLLQNKFCASSALPMNSVRMNRSLLESAARKLLMESAYEEDGSIVIRAKDI
jgi:hypothetical protein